MNASQIESNSDQPQPGVGRNLLLAIVVISVSVAGYFTGIQSPMNKGESWIPHTGRRTNTESTTENPAPEPIHASGVIPATQYARMNRTLAGRGTRPDPVTNRKLLERMAKNANERVWSSETVILKPSLDQKISDLEIRSQNRQFNGAPPTVPHPIDPISDASCVACHKSGGVSKTLRIPQMSHQFLTKCTQCHVESGSSQIARAPFAESTFVGLPAPLEGPRAFPQAPPLIPHSTWMRSNCLACHGPAGRTGLQSTHPWRKNCLQCHPPSFELDQAPIDHPDAMLPPPPIETNPKD